MEVCKTIEAIGSAVSVARRAGRSIGLVPTMGALHAGHASLIDAAAADGHFVVVTIFVNPTQFAPHEDLAAYPRTPEADLELCGARGAAAVFMPSAAEMYPREALTKVSVARLTDGLCGRRRAGHFDGVCTVVAKLLNIVQPDAAYFGQKDAQQAAVIRRMIEDLNVPVRLVVRPTVREADGLACSSRNRYLSDAERPQASELYAALEMASGLARQGATDARRIIEAVKAHLAARAPLGEVDYVEIIDPLDLDRVEELRGPVLIALAVRFGAARLIDNILVDSPPRRA